MKTGFPVNLGGIAITILEAILNNGIHIDFNEEIMYGYPQKYKLVCGNEWVREVDFYIILTEELGEIADGIRTEYGHMPFFSKTGKQGEEHDAYGYYNFYCGLNSKNKYKVGDIIVFTVQSDYADDDGKEYYIELSLEEQKLLYECIDKQFRMELGESVEDVLAEAEKEMEV